jgi:hemolysin TlyA family protein
MAKKRVDIILFEQGYFDSREQAKRAVMAGIVYNLKTQERIEKPGTAVDETIEIEIKGKKIPFVSRGGLKLAKAIEEFNINVKDRIVLDIGSSTGGFTDCCLQNGAKFVYALDVGTNQLVWKLRSHPQVKTLENQNFRNATIELFTEGLPSLIVTDVSFISLTIILEQVDVLFGKQDFQMVALIKPQFEAGKALVGKNGIVHDPKIHENVINKISDFVLAKDWQILGLCPSPITGAKGNKEFLLYFENKIDINNLEL